MIEFGNQWSYRDNFPMSEDELDRLGREKASEIFDFNSEQNRIPSSVGSSLVSFGFVVSSQGDHGQIDHVPKGFQFFRGPNGRFFIKFFARLMDLSRNAMVKVIRVGDVRCRAKWPSENW